MEKVSGEWESAISPDARTRGHLWETHLKQTKGMPISHRAYLNCGAYCHSSRSWISHPEEMHVEGVQGTNRFQKGWNDFVEERAHGGTTQSCLDVFSSIQSAQTVVDCWNCNGTEGEGSLLFRLCPDCLHWKPGVRLDGPWLWSNSASIVSVGGNQPRYLKTTISGSCSLDGAFRCSFRHLNLVLRNLKVQIHFIYIKHILKQFILFWDLSLQCSVLVIWGVLHWSKAHRTEGHTPAQMSLT